MSEITRYDPADGDYRQSSDGLMVKYADHAARVQALERQVADLKDHAKVHTAILRGEIALTKAEAIHIAGLPADIEQRNRELVEALEEIMPLVADTIPSPSHEGPCGPEANCDGLCVAIANVAQTLSKARAAIAKERGE